ncbi:UDP-3-O-acylglucosamine N-acyltransferase [Aureimonas endophytica]|uniref:UDP-3-O-acylglucosamine N-acyltransferase n=1 Tax=Aureimonas endophytica TaxID=2027858 RepID=A0A916ZDM9_9HYPH|nr:UDP-3-O-(3-hydroxymyristoyl)glucosamine N-acyltransferase [Aureimonas endophytica]GGD89376.1 UDP-3-O-acylglucosamine N-acyltransferase [Aureimonas endophytica]
MTDISFFAKGQGLTLRELAELTGGELVGPSAAEIRIDGLAPLDEAKAGDLSFFDNARYASALAATAASCVIVAKRNLPHLPSHLPGIVARDPGLAFTLAGQALYPEALSPAGLGGAGVSPAAHVDPSARLEDGVAVEPGAVIGAGVAIGAGTRIGANAVIGPGCRIGRHCSIGAGSTVQFALIGNRVVLHPGVRIGQDGFGYAAGPKGIVKTVQIGRVIIQDDVEIGANTTVDRGGIRDTVIGESTKIDNQVQIGHNVRIGRSCIIVSQVALAGSVTLGDGVSIGGQTVVNNHAVIGDGARIAAISSVAGDIAPGAKVGGSPAKPVRDWFREITWVSEMAKAGRRGNANESRDDDA